jgi:hypothetical protein
MNMNKTFITLILAASMAACSPRMVYVPTTEVRTDTTVVVRDRTVTDTLLLGPEYGDTATVICPPGLTRDSIVYLYDHVYLPGRKVPYRVTVRDTVWKTQTVQSTVGMPTDHLPYWASALLSLLAMAIGYFIKKLNKDDNGNNGKQGA